MFYDRLYTPFLHLLRLTNGPEPHACLAATGSSSRENRHGSHAPRERIDSDGQNKKSDIRRRLKYASRGLDPLAFSVRYSPLPSPHSSSEILDRTYAAPRCTDHIRDRRSSCRASRPQGGGRNRIAGFR